MAPPSTPPKGQSIRSSQKNSSITPKTSPSLSPSNSISAAWSADELSADTIKPTRQQQQQNRMSSSPLKFDSTTSPRWQQQSKPNSPKRTTTDQQQRLTQSTDEKQRKQHQMSFLLPSSADGQSSESSSGRTRKTQRSSSTAGIFDIDTDDAASDADTTIAQASGHSTNTASLLARYEGLNRSGSLSKLPQKQLRQGKGSNSTSTSAFIGGSSGRHLSSGSGGDGNSSSGSSSSSIVDGGSGGSSTTLSVPLPVPHHSTTLPSPTTRHARGLFDATPSFSSPLAYAPLLPSEMADDLDLDSPVPRQNEGESSSLGSSSTHKTLSSPEQSKQTLENKTERSMSQSIDNALTSKKSPKLDSETNSPSFSPQLSSRKSGHSASSSISTTMGPPLTIPRKSSGQSSGHASAIGSSSIRLPEGGEGGPKQVRALLQRGKGGSGNMSGSGPGSRRVSEATSDDGSYRSASGSSTGSVAYSQSGTSTNNSLNNSWAAMNALTPTQNTTTPSSSHQNTTIATPQQQNRARSNTQSSVSSIHRRARSLGGSLLGELASSIGGPDGVDPNLVAAIRAGDAEIPGGSNNNVLSDSATIRQLHDQLAAASSSNNLTPSTSASNNLSSSMTFSNAAGMAGHNASVPSTPSGSLRIVSRRGELLTVNPETRTLGTSYPSFAVQNDEEYGDEDSNHTGKRRKSSMSSNVIPQDYVRSRVRSQTTAGQPFTSSEQFSPRSIDHQFLNARQSIQSYDHPSLGLRSQSRNREIGGHGLGIGMEGNTNESNLQIPHDQQSGGGMVEGSNRSASPLMYHDSAILSSASTSGRTSPVVWRHQQGDGMSDSLFAPREIHNNNSSQQNLSVKIPTFDRQQAGMGPISALPALNYSPQSSPVMRTNLLPLSKSPGDITGRSISSEVSPEMRTRPIPDLEGTQGVPVQNRQEDGTRGRTSLSHAVSIRGRGKRDNAGTRRFSTVQAPHGIDEYAQIIIQSRNAKMQKWKASSSNATGNQRGLGPAFGNESTADQSENSVNKEADGSRTIIAATPNVSPANSLSGEGEEAISSPNDDSGKREIEWVDWLDEYRKLKEAKLRAEKEESSAVDIGKGEEKQPQKEEKEKTSKDSTVESNKSSPISAQNSPSSSSPHQSQTLQTPSKETRRKNSQSQMHISKSVTSNLDYGQGRSLPRRRPSDLPIRSNQFADGNRSWSASLSPNTAFLPSSAGSRSGHNDDDRSLAAPTNYASLGRRSSIMGLGGSNGEKSRTLSLSPITSRIGSSGSYQSGNVGNSGNASSGRRKKLLGSKIEAWWGAVKSGFGGVSTLPPASAPAHSRHSIRNSIAMPTDASDITSGMSKLGINDNSAFRGGSDLQQVRSMFGDHGGFSQGHLRSQTHRQPSEAKSVHTLKPSLSAQDLKRCLQSDPNTGVEGGGSTDASSSVDQQFQKSDRSSVDTAHQATAPPSSSRTERSRDRKSDAASEQECSETMSNDGSSSVTGTNNNNNAASKPRKGPKLSLHLEHGLSTFDAGPFEHMTPGSQSVGGVDTSDATDNKINGLQPSNLKTASSKSSPSSKDPPVSLSPKSSGLSDAWKPSGGRSPHSPHSGKAASPASGDGGQAQPSPNSRGGSKLRDSVSAIGVETERKRSSQGKDITIDSIRTHIHHRLTLSKENCDRELRKIILAINAYVEEGIQDQQIRFLQQQEDEQDEIESTRRALENIEIETQNDLAGMAYDSNKDKDDNLPSPLEGKGEGLSKENENMESGMGAAPDESSLISSNANDAAADDLLGAPRSRQTSVNVIGKGEYSLPPPPQRTPSSMMRSMSRGNIRNRSRELTSTSTSRSHSPLPGSGAIGGQGSIYGADSPQYSPARRIRPLPLDDIPLQPFIGPLQDLVGIAMDVLDTTINNLTSRTGACREIISNVQEIGHAWEEHPDWPGRGWYVQLLLAVAGLSRVVEWWEAERGFWNFADDVDEFDQEPIRFIVGGQSSNQNHQSSAGPISSITDGTSTTEYNDPLPSTNTTSTARSLISSSPMRMIRSAALTQASANRTPSQQSSATNSPALEPADRRTFGESTDALRSTHSSTPILPAPLDDDDDEPQNLDGVEQQEDAAATAADTTTTVAALPSSVKDSQNILMELSLDGERFLYLSPAWQTVLGSDPGELFDQPIEEVLAPGDAQTFAEATQQLQSDDSHTVEAAFRLLVHPSIIPDSDGNTRYYQEMEGKGMLMQDRQNGSPSHTMWVFKPTGPPEPEDDLAPGPQKPSTAGVGDLSMAGGTSVIDAGQQNPFLSTEPLLCRICERDVPTWFFEKHSEICNEIHRLEMEISESNEILAELRRTSRTVVTQIESNEEPIEYRNVLLTTPAASTLPPSALEVANRSLSPRHPNPAAIRKAHLRALTGLIDILRVAGTISTPATKDDADPIEKERLLSPESESKIVQVRNWKIIPLPAEDAAIELLAADVDAAMRRKLSAVNRMLNTIVYVETVRMEWEQRVEEALAEMQGTTLDLDVTEDDVGEDETQDQLSPRQQDEDREMEEEDEEQHRSSSTIAHSEVDNKPANALTKLMASNQLSNDPSTIDSLPPSRAQPVPSKLAQSSNQIEEDDIDGDSSAVLLEQYDNESAVPGSTTLSAKGDDLGGEDEIPAVETAMGGSVLRPIPIPTRTNIAPRIRQMQRDTSAVSSSSGGDGGSSLAQSSTGTGGGTTGEGSKTIIDQTSPSAPLVPHSRRQSIMSGERAYLQTPPLSPRHSPKELTIPLRSVKDRRVSQSMRSMGGQSPYLGGASAGGLPHSPRIPPMAPSSRPTASSIKDFDIIKPISKGAFGSVFLTRKRTTGDYYAIKVLKKSDMIAKNQITNVKAERMILMTQTQSPFVVKLFFTFQSSENLYLVMEYLPGGDLANLVKNLGSLSEEWTKQFVAEVVNGLEMLHGQGVVHRDMKPDNLLIDQKGHLKLTDFGLSKIGLLGRQNRQQMQQTPLQPASASMTTTNSGGRGSQSAGSGSTPPSSWQHMKKDSISSTTTSGSLSYSPLSSRLPSSARAASIPDTPSLIGSQPFYVGTPTHPRGRIMSASTDASDSSGSEGALAFSNPNGTNSTSNTLRNLQSTSLLDSPKNAFGSIVGNTQGSGSGSGGAMIGSIGGQAGSGSSSQLKKFVGTPDYLAPESILGLGMDDAAVDWWALGVILYELLYGYPPFHAETPEKVFDNILSRNISWEDEDIEISAEARDLMEKLMCTDRKNRLGTNGTKEIKSHPFFTGIDWDNLTEEEGPFVPQINDPESTDYFDLRGAVFMDLQNEDGNQSANGKDGLQAHSSNNMGMHEFAKAIEGHARFSEPSRPPTRGRTRSGKHPKDSSQGQTDEFGSFSYKNLPVLKQANDEVIKKMRGDQLNSMSAAMEQQQQANATGANLIHARHRSISGKVVTPSSHRGSAVWMPVGPPSPTTSVSSQSSVPSKSTAPTSPSGAPFMLGNVGGGNAAYLMHNLVGGGNGSGSASASLYNPHRRRPSEMSSNTGLAGSPIGSMSGSSTTGPLATMMERKRSQFAANNQAEEDIRRTSLPTRLRTASVSTNSGGGNGIGSRQQQQHQFGHNERPVLPWQLQVPSNVLPDITAEESYKASPLTGITNSEGNITTDSSTNSGGLGLSGTSNQPASSSPLTVAGSSAPLTGISSTSGIGIKEKESSVDQINCMIAEDNPISSKMLEGILTKLGCKSMSVRNGAEALRLAMGETKFSVLFIDVTLPIVSGQDVAKMIKSTRNINSITPIIALASFDKSGSLVTNPNSNSTMMTSSGTNSAAHALDILLESTGGVFDAVLAKPVDKQDICSVLPKFGFQLLTTTKYGGGSSGGGGMNSNVSGLNLPTPSTAQSEGITTNVSRRATIAHQGEQQNIGNRQITSAT